jgi:hypothetical protein
MGGKMSLRVKQKTNNTTMKKSWREKKEKKARGRREGKGGGEEEKRQLEVEFCENEKFRGSREITCKRNNLNIYIEITQDVPNILYFSSLDLSLLFIPLEIVCSDWS